MPANRTTFQFQGAYERELVHIYARVQFGATGAPTLVSADSRAVASIVRNSAGNYTITLQNTYSRLMALDRIQVVPTGVPAAPGFFMVSADPTSAKTIVVQFTSVSTPTDPASGEEARLHIIMSNVAKT